MCGNYGNESEERGYAINTALFSQWISDRKQVYIQEWISLMFSFFSLRRLEEWSNYLQDIASGSVIYQAWSFKSAANTRQALIKKKKAAKMIPHNWCCN